MVAELAATSMTCIVRVRVRRSQKRCTLIFILFRELKRELYCTDEKERAAGDPIGVGF